MESLGAPGRTVLAYGAWRPCEIDAIFIKRTGETPEHQNVTHSSSQLLVIIITFFLVIAIRAYYYRHNFLILRRKVSGVVQ